MKEGELVNIRYTKKDDTTERTIIPLSVPNSNIKALDVSGLNEEDRAHLQQLVADYQQYCRDVLSTLFRFEDWVEHTQQQDVSDKVAWRTFKQDQTEELS